MITNYRQTEASASATIGGTTPKPEGLLGKVKDIFKEVKDTVADKKEEKKPGVAAEGSINIGPIQASASIGASGSSGSGASGSSSWSSSTTQAPSSWLFGGSSQSRSDESSWENKNMGDSSASASMQMSTSKPFLEKIGDMARKGKEAIKEGAESIVGGGEGKGGALDKVQRLVTKGADAVRDTAHRLEDKASEMGEKLTNSIDESVKRPMSSVSGSGQYNSEGRMTAEASFNTQLRGSERDRYLYESKRRQENEMGSRPNSIKDIVNNAKAKGIIPQYEDKSALKGYRDDEKNVAVEVFDKAHEVSKLPVETIMKPIDKMLGYEKDPLMKIYDNSHELLRKPLSLITKPVDNLLTGAFKTTEESKRETERLLASSSEQERREARLREERQRERSVVGNIADKTVDLATKPIEIVLRPVDHMFGLDKKGKKNPLLALIDEIYTLSKKPVDQLAKPFERMLRRMGEGEQPMYQISIRYTNDENDPKLVTRLADGALNIAGRAISKPLEVFLRPLNHALGYDDPGKKNPILEAMNQLKNATKGGVELFTRPIDRIIKEIADIGDIKDEQEREMMWQRKREEAGRIVKALDRLHEVLQIPMEIVLRPVGNMLGVNPPGQKDPILRAWDVVHQVVRTPIQVITRPIEDAILGENTRQRQAAANAKAQANRKNPSSTSGDRSGIAIPLQSELNKNVFITKIRQAEKIAIKPLEAVTSPIRRLIMGEDDGKRGTGVDKNNRDLLGKNDPAQMRRQNNDRIMRTIDKINNVALMPIDIITQPISDLITGEKKFRGRKFGNQYANQNSKSKGLEVKGQVQAKTNQHEASATAQMKVKS